MTVPVADIIDSVQTLLLDEDGVRWPVGELVEWLNEAVRETIRYVPDAGIITDDLTLVTGSRQTLPTDGLRLVDVICNTTGGEAIRLMDRAVLDVYRPEWRTETGTLVEGFTFDAADPKKFEVFPGLDPLADITIVYQAIPAEVDIDGNLPIDDIYQASTANYIMARAYLKDSEDSSADIQRAQAFYASFFQSLGVKQAVDLMAEPNRVK